MKRALADSGQVVNRGRDVVVHIEARLIGLEVGSQVYGLCADTLARLQDEEGMPVVRVGSRGLIPVVAADAYFAAPHRRERIMNVALALPLERWERVIAALNATGERSIAQNLAGQRAAHIVHALQEPVPTPADAPRSAVEAQGPVESLDGSGSRAVRRPAIVSVPVADVERGDILVDHGVVRDVGPALGPGMRLIICGTTSLVMRADELVEVRS